MKNPYSRIVAVLLVLCLLSEPGLGAWDPVLSPLLFVKTPNASLFQQQAIDARLASAHFLSGQFQAPQFIETVKKWLGTVSLFPDSGMELVGGFPVIPDRVGLSVSKDHSVPSFWGSLLNHFSSQALGTELGGGAPTTALAEERFFITFDIPGHALSVPLKSGASLYEIQTMEKPQFLDTISASDGLLRKMALLSLEPQVAQNVITTYLIRRQARGVWKSGGKTEDPMPELLRNRYRNPTAGIEWARHSGFSADFLDRLELEFLNDLAVLPRVMTRAAAIRHMIENWHQMPKGPLRTFLREIHLQPFAASRWLGDCWNQGESLRKAFEPSPATSKPAAQTPEEPDLTDNTLIPDDEWRVWSGDARFAAALNQVRESLKPAEADVLQALRHAEALPKHQALEFLVTRYGLAPADVEESLTSLQVLGFVITRRSDPDDDGVWVVNVPLVEVVGGSSELEDFAQSFNGLSIQEAFNRLTPFIEGDFVNSKLQRFRRRTKFPRRHFAIDLQMAARSGYLSLIAQMPEDRYEVFKARLMLADRTRVDAIRTSLSNTSQNSDGSDEEVTLRGVDTVDTYNVAQIIRKALEVISDPSRVLLDLPSGAVRVERRDALYLLKPGQKLPSLQELIERILLSVFTLVPEGDVTVRLRASPDDHPEVVAIAVSGEGLEISEGFMNRLRQQADPLLQAYHADMDFVFDGTRGGIVVRLAIGTALFRFELPGWSKSVSEFMDTFNSMREQENPSTLDREAMSEFVLEHHNWMNRLFAWACSCVSAGNLPEESLHKHVAAIQTQMGSLERENTAEFSHRMNRILKSMASLEAAMLQVPPLAGIQDGMSLSTLLTPLLRSENVLETDPSGDPEISPEPPSKTVQIKRVFHSTPTPSSDPKQFVLSVRAWLFDFNRDVADAFLVDNDYFDGGKLLSATGSEGDSKRTLLILMDQKLTLEKREAIAEAWLGPESVHVLYDPLQWVSRWLGYLAEKEFRIIPIDIPGAVHALPHNRIGSERRDLLRVERHHIINQSNVQRVLSALNERKVPHTSEALAEGLGISVRELSAFFVQKGTLRIAKSWGYDPISSKEAMVVVEPESNVDSPPAFSFVPDLPEERPGVEGLDYFTDDYFSRELKRSELKLVKKVAPFIAAWPAETTLAQLLRGKETLGASVTDEGLQRAVTQLFDAYGYVQNHEDKLRPEFVQDVLKVTSQAALNQEVARWLEWRLTRIARRSEIWQKEQTLAAHHSPVILQRTFTILMDDVARTQIGEAETLEEKLAIIRDLGRRRLIAVQTFLGTTPLESPVAAAPAEAPAPLLKVETHTPKTAPTRPAPTAPPSQLPSAAASIRKPVPVQNNGREQERLRSIARFQQEWESLIAWARRIESIKTVDRVMGEADLLFKRSRTVFPDAEVMYDQVRYITQKRTREIQQPFKQDLLPGAPQRPDADQPKPSKKFKVRFRPPVPSTAREKPAKRSDSDATKSIEQSQAYTPPTRFQRVITWIINRLPKGIGILAIGLLISQLWPHQGFGYYAVLAAMGAVFAGFEVPDPPTEPKRGPLTIPPADNKPPQLIKTELQDLIDRMIKANREIKDVEHLPSLRVENGWSFDVSSYGIQTPDGRSIRAVWTYVEPSALKSQEAEKGSTLLYDATSGVLGFAGNVPGSEALLNGLLAMLDGNEVEQVTHSLSRKRVLGAFPNRIWDGWSQRNPFPEYRMEVDPLIENTVRSILGARRLLTPVIWDFCGGEGSLVRRLSSQFPKTRYVLVERNEMNIQQASIYPSDAIQIFQRDIRTLQNLRKNLKSTPSIVIAEGGLNVDVLSREKALAVARRIYEALPDLGLFIVTGWSPALLDAEDFSAIGFSVLNRTMPQRIKNHQVSTQFYILEKREPVTLSDPTADRIKLLKYANRALEILGWGFLHDVHAVAEKASTSQLAVDLYQGDAGRMLRDVKQKNSPARQWLINFLAPYMSQMTYFFRQPWQFKVLEEELPNLIERRRQERARSIRVWSLGASTGEEALSAASICLSLRDLWDGLRFRIEGFEIVRKRVHTANVRLFELHPSPIYEEKMIRYLHDYAYNMDVEDLPAVIRQRMRDRGQDAAHAAIELVNELRPLMRNIVHFHALSIMELVHRTLLPDIVFLNYLVYQMTPVAKLHLGRMLQRLPAGAHLLTIVNARELTRDLGMKLSAFECIYSFEGVGAVWKKSLSMSS